MFFIDGVGRSSKRFTYGCILTGIRGLGKVALSVASSSIVALLLEGGTTAIPDLRSLCKDWMRHPVASWAEKLAPPISSELLQ